jgi:hypothetical protein
VFRVFPVGQVAREVVDGQRLVRRLDSTPLVPVGPQFAVKASSTV